MRERENETPEPERDQPDQPEEPHLSADDTTPRRDLDRFTSDRGWDHSRQR